VESQLAEVISNASYVPVAIPESPTSLIHSPSAHFGPVALSPITTPMVTLPRVVREYNPVTCEGTTSQVKENLKSPFARPGTPISSFQEVSSFPRKVFYLNHKPPALSLEQELLQDGICDLGEYDPTIRRIYSAQKWFGTNSNVAMGRLSTIHVGSRETSQI